MSNDAVKALAEEAGSYPEGSGMWHMCMNAIKYIANIERDKEILKQALANHAEEAARKPAKRRKKRG